MTYDISTDKAASCCRCGVAFPTDKEEQLNEGRPDGVLCPDCACEDGCERGCWHDRNPKVYGAPVAASVHEAR